MTGIAVGGLSFGVAIVEGRWLATVARGGARPNDGPFLSLDHVLFQPRTVFQAPPDGILDDPFGKILFRADSQAHGSFHARSSEKPLGSSTFEPTPDSVGHNAPADEPAD